MSESVFVCFTKTTLKNALFLTDMTLSTDFVIEEYDITIIK